MINRNTTESGFALLLTLVVVSAVISIGLTLLDLTIKQLRLATSAKDSENAFHAANAGVECLRYWRLASSTEFESGAGNTVNMGCFGSSVRPTKDSNPVFDGSVDDIYKYGVEFNWTANDGSQRCSRISFITLSSDPASTGVTLTNVPTYMPSYPETNKFCPAGGRCTIASVQGYNQPCSIVTSGSVGTVQREVLLEL